MYYYKVLDLNNTLIDKVSSFNLRYAHKGKIFACQESLAQYVWAGDQLYRIGWLHDENEDMKGKYPFAQMLQIDQEEYETYMKEKIEKENLESK